MCCASPRWGQPLVQEPQQVLARTQGMRRAHVAQAWPDREVGIRNGGRIVRGADTCSTVGSVGKDNERPELQRLLILRELFLQSRKPADHRAMQVRRRVLRLVGAKFFDAARVVAHPELSLAGGAVRGWDRRNAYYFQLISSLAEHYGFDVETPFEELPEEIRDIILYGSRGEEIRFRYLNEHRGSVERRHSFEGIISNMQRRYRETESNVVREELARYLGNQPCPDCGGARLNEAARHVLPEQAKPGWDCVLTGRKDVTANRDFADLKSDLRQALARVHAKS